MISEFSKPPERLFSCIPSYFYNSTIILGKCKITTLTSYFQCDINDVHATVPVYSLSPVALKGEEEFLDSG